MITTIIFIVLSTYLALWFVVLILCFAAWVKCKIKEGFKRK